MSTSQTFTAGCSAVGSFSYAGNFTLYVVLTDRDGNAGTNKSKVDYNVYCQSNGSGSINARHYKYFSINGEEKINTTEIINVSSPYAYIPIASGTIEVTHNSDGSKSIPFSAEIQGASFGVSASVSGTFQLEKIPRYFSSTPSITLSNRTLTSITFKWSTSETCDKIDYNLSGTSKGKIWTGSATSGTLTVSGLRPNTSYSIYIWCRRKDSQLGSTSNTISVTTYDIARLTEAPAVNIGSSHTIKWTNPGSATTSLKLCKTDGTQIINYGTVTGTSKKITPTASTIYALTPNSNSITLRYILTTTQGSYTTTNYKDCNFSVTNSNPTFSNFTYQDTDSTVVALTGNNQTIVKGYSNVKGIVSTANKATANNSAKMSKYRLSIGESTAEVAYSSSAEVSVTIANVSSNSFTMYAIDSRGNSTGKAITASKYINYSDIKITSISAVRTNSVTSETTLKFSGTVWNGSFGSVTNSIVTCYYRYRLSTSSTWTTGATTITPTKSGSTFSFSGIIAGDLGATGFNINNSYVIQVIIADKLSRNSSSPATFTLGPGTPAMAIYKNNVAIGQRYDTSDGSKLQVNGTVKAPTFDGNATSATNLNGGILRSLRSFLFTLNAINASGRFYKLAKIPATADNNAIQLNIRGSLGHWSTGKATIDLQISNRTNLQVFGNFYGASAALDAQRIVIYQETDGSHSVYLYNATTYTGPNTLEITWGGFNIYPTIYTDYSYTTTPTGKNVFSSTANAIGRIQRMSVLYDNSTGTTGTVTLSESAANFSYLEIAYTKNGQIYSTGKIPSPNQKKIYLQIGQWFGSANSVQMGYEACTVSGTSITRGTYYFMNTSTGGGVSAGNATNDIAIIKVTGYR